jgi:hypothetical protein
MTSGLLKSIDLISYQPKLYTSGKDRYKTVFGGVTQLILGIIFLAGMLYFSQDIYNRINPNVISSASKIIFKDKFRFQTKFSVYISVMDPMLGIPFRNESIYSLKFYQNILDIEKGFITKPLESEVCSKDSFEEQIPQYILDTWNWESYTCIKKGSEAYLKGSDMDLSNWFLTAFIAPCDRSVVGNKCGTEQEIRAKLTGANVQSFLIDKFLDPNNYTNPIQYYNKMIVTAASIGYKNLGWYKFKTINLVDDVGLLFQVQDTRTVIAFDEVTTSFGPSTPGDPNIFQFIYQQSTNVETVTRRYKRLQEVVASVGGLLSAINIIARTIVLFLSEKYYFDYLFEKYFDVKNQNKNRTSPIQFKNLENHTTSPNKKILKSPDFLPKKDGADKQKLYSNPTKIFTKTFLLRKKNKKENFTKKESSLFFKSMMDYEYIMTKFKENELLKLIIFSSKQNKIFDKIADTNSFTHLFWRTGDIPDNYRVEENETISNALGKIEEYLS